MNALIDNGTLDKNESVMTLDLDHKHCRSESSFYIYDECIESIKDDLK